MADLTAAVRPPEEGARPAQQPEPEEREYIPLTTDLPPLRPDVAYAIDRESMERAHAIERLNKLGAAGLLQNRLRFDELRAAKSKAELELHLFAEQNPWAVAPPWVAPPPAENRASKDVMALVFASVVLVATVIAAAKYQRPREPSAAHSTLPAVSVAEATPPPPPEPPEPDHARQGRVRTPRGK